MLIEQPWLAGIFAGTLFWVGLRWLTTILPGMHYLYYEKILELTVDSDLLVLHILQSCFRCLVQLVWILLFLHNVLRARICSKARRSDRTEGSY